MTLKHASSQIFWVTVGRVFSRGSILITSILLARALSVKDFASFSYFLLTINMLAAYASMGLGITANRYFVGAENADAAKSKIIATISSLSLFFSVFLVITIFFVPGNILLGDYAIKRWIIALGIFIFSMEVVPQNALAGLEKYGPEAFLSILSGVLTIVISLYAAQHQNLILAMLALIYGSLLRVLGSTALVVRAMGWSAIKNSIPFSKKDVVHVLGFSLPMFLVALIASTGPWAVGRIISSGPQGDYAFALFAIGLQWFSLGMFLPASISRISAPKMVRSIDNPRPEDPVKKHLYFGIKLSLAASVSVALGGVVFSPYIMKLYGSAYETNQWVLSAFLFLAIVASSSQMVGILIVFSHHQWGWLKVNLGFLATIILVAAVLMNQGVWAGLISLFAAYSFLLLTSIFYIKKAMLLKNGAEAMQK